MVLLFNNKPKTRTRQGTPSDTAVVTPAATANSVETPAVETPAVEAPAAQPQGTVADGTAASTTARRPLSSDYILAKDQFDYDREHPQKFETNMPKPAQPPATDAPAYNPETVDFTNPQYAQKPAEFTPNIPGAEEGERKMRYIGPYDEGTYNYLAMQADMGNLPQEAIYQDAFDRVYGEKPGFVATDERDGGFWDWARNVVDPEELRKAQKENKTRMGIIALADALRHFGNIYHTTKGAPAQTLTNATEKEYQRQQQEEQLAIERLQKQYESDMKRLDLQYKRAMEEQRYKDAQEIKRMQLELQKSQQEATERYREQQQQNWQDKFEADERHREVMESQGQQRIYISGARGGGGSRGGGSRGGGVRGGGGRYRVSGGGKGKGGRGGSGGTAADGGEVKYSFEVPDSIARRQGDKDAYVEKAYSSLVKAGFASAGKRTIGTKKEEIERQLRNPAVRKTLQMFGITVYENGAATGRGRINPVWQGKAVKGAQGVYNQGSKGGSKGGTKGGTGGGAKGGSKGSGVTAANGGSGQAMRGGQTGQSGRGAASAAQSSVAGGSSKGGAAKPAAKGSTGSSTSGRVGAPKQTGNYRTDYTSSGSSGGTSGGASSGTGGRGRQGGSKWNQTAMTSAKGVYQRKGGSVSGDYDHYNDGRTRTSHDFYGNSGLADQRLNIPTEVRNPKTGKWRFQTPEETLKKLYNTFVSRGWVGGGARTQQDMVDAIYDNIDNEDVARTLDLLEIRYDPDYYWAEADNWE